MKGLILKDFYMIMKYCRSFIFIVIVFLAFSCFGNGSSFFVIYPTLIAGIIPVTLISYDERERWNIYSAALPYTKAQIVSSKYLIGLISELAVIFLSAVMQAYHMVNVGSFAWNDFMSYVFSILVIGLIGPSLLLPLVFKFGAEKGRIAFYIVIGSLCAIGTIASESGFNISEQYMPEWMLAAITAAVMILYAVSWSLSVLFYRQKEL
jgi:ABC-2 type transport system permease protein